MVRRNVVQKGLSLKLQSEGEKRASSRPKKRTANVSNEGGEEEVDGASHGIDMVN